MAAHTPGPGTIGYLEKQAGITDRAAFWLPFAKIKGTKQVGRVLVDAGFTAGVAELRRLAAIAKAEGGAE